MLADAVLLVAWVASPGPVSRMTLAELTARADVILTGTVTAVTVVGGGAIGSPSGPISGHIMGAAFRPDSVLKGGSQSIDRFEFTVPADSPTGYTGVPTGQYLVCFLSSSRDGWTALDNDTPCLVARPTSRALGIAPLDAVSEVIGAVISDPLAPESEKTQALLTLSFSRSPAATLAMEAGMNDKDPAIRFRAAAMLISSNRIQGLPLAESALLGKTPASPEILAWLRSAIEAGLTDPAAIPALERISQSDDVASRRAALEALGRTGSARAFPELVSALTSTDLDSQWLAVKGLSRITGVRNHTTTQEHFEEGLGAPFVSYWIAWARSQGMVR